MDEKKYLILDTRKGYKDLTGEIISLTERKDKFEIVFRENGKSFFYSKKNIHIETSPASIESDIEINGRISFLPEQKLLFGKFLKIFHSEGQPSELYSENYKIHRTRIADILNYFFIVAREIKNIPSEDLSVPVNSIVAEAISKIQYVTVGSPLFLYLTGTTRKTDDLSSNFVFPFQCNESQLNAVEKTFSNRLTLIQGPPGTGKTQTILNILMNALLRNMSVAVVSNNNAAIQNIMDKLKTAGRLDFMAAMLGNNENQAKFLHEQPEYPDWLKSNIELPPEIESQLNQLEIEIKQLYAAQNTLRKKQKEKTDWQFEAKKFAQCYPSILKIQDNRLSSKKLLEIFTRCNSYAIREKKISFWFKIWNVIFCHYWNLTFWNQPTVNVLTAIKNLFYRKKIEELQKEISEISQLLNQADFEKKQQQLNTLSKLFLKAKLQKKYCCAKSKKRPLFQKNELTSDKFRAEYPIILSTTFMIKKFTPESGFDLIIMDEASQVDLCTGIVALSCAKNAVIVGDDKQLPCVITQQDDLKLAKLNVSTSIDEKYLYRSGQSILRSILSAIPDIPNIVLREHYRCDPLIIGFCNKRFYNNELIIHSKQYNAPSLHIVFTMPGNHARGHFNLRQSQEIEVLKQKLIERGYSNDSIGVCTPYRLQAEITGASTVHKFQGREKDVIIMSTVDNSISPFVADKQLVNVAVSRAKKEFYLIISSSNSEWDNCIGDLVNYIKYYDISGNAVLQGNIISVFDKLYEECQNQFGESNHQNILFDSPAEKIIYHELIEIIRKNDIDQRYSFKMHIPIRELFKTDYDLSEEENDYLLNAFTHVDFLIYERFGMTPRFAIEVDGYAYHKKGTRQAVRDSLKNNIFRKRRFPLLRLSTIDSGERERITKFIFGSRTRE